MKNTTKTGNLGESVVVEWLKRNKYQVLGRNYRCKVAEIDIIATKDKVVHFIEVKTFSHETLDHLESSVSYGTYQPEDLVDGRKLRKLQQGIAIWLQEYQYEGEYQLDIASVRIVEAEKVAQIKLIEAISLE